MLRQIAEQSSSQANSWPLVSICCATYQHEKYVRETLDAFLSQITSFPVEIIIHDDASTDATQEVIAEYEQRFPSVFQTVLQSVNQLSQGREIFSSLYEMAAGKYVALCEGDDYWTDPRKLQKQVDLLEANPSASGCFHRADDLQESDGTVAPGKWGPGASKPSFTVDDLLRCGTFGPTASLVFRRDCVVDIPRWAKQVPHGDFGLLAFAMLSGPMLYLPEAMSVYRRHGGGIHSTTYGPVASLRAIQSLVHVGHTLGLQDRESYLDGLRWRLAELDEAIRHQRDSAKGVIEQLEQLRQQVERSAQSRWYRMGLQLDKILRRLKVR